MESGYMLGASDSLNEAKKYERSQELDKEEEYFDTEFYEIYDKLTERIIVW